MVLLIETVVDDLPPLAERVRPGVDQRFVFEMLDLTPLDEIELQQWAVQPAAAFVDDQVGVEQELPRRCRHVVQQTIRPERVLVDVPRGEPLQHGVEHLRVLHSPRDAVEVQAADVVLVEEREDIVVRSLLRNVVPRFGVDLRRLVDHVQSDRRRRGDQRLVLRDVNGEVRELPRCREVEVVLDRLRVIRLEIDVDGLRRLAVQNGDRPLWDLHQNIQLLPGRSRIRDDDLAAVDRVDEEFFRHVLVDRLAVLLPSAVAVSEEVLADEYFRNAVGCGCRFVLFVEDHDRRGG